RIILGIRGPSTVQASRLVLAFRRLGLNVERSGTIQIEATQSGGSACKEPFADGHGGCAAIRFGEAQPKGRGYDQVPIEAVLVLTLAKEGNEISFRPNELGGYRKVSCIEKSFGRIKRIIPRVLEPSRGNRRELESAFLPRCLRVNTNIREVHGFER